MHVSTDDIKASRLELLVYGNKACINKPKKLVIFLIWEGTAFPFEILATDTIAYWFTLYTTYTIYITGSARKFLVPITKHYYYILTVALL